MRSVKKITIVFASIFVLCFFQKITFSKEIINPSNVSINNDEEVFVLSGYSIFKYDYERKNKLLLNDHLKFVGYDSNTLFLGPYWLNDFDIKESNENITYSFRKVYKGGINLLNPKETERDFKEVKKVVFPKISKYFRCPSKLEEIIKRVVYPEYISAGPEGNIYVLGKDIFRKHYKLGILDPNDGHPIAVYDAVDKSVIKTRVDRLRKVISKKDFESRKMLEAYLKANETLFQEAVGENYLNEILKMLPEGDKWRSLRNNIMHEWHLGEVVVPHGIAVDNEGNFYITDYWDNKVKIFDKQGNYKFSFGDFGEKDGQFKSIQGITIDQRDGSIYVVENYSPSMFYGYEGEKHQKRIQKFDKNGKFILKFGETRKKGYIWWPFNPSWESDIEGAEDVAVDSKGNVYVVSNYGEIHKYTGNGSFIKKWGKQGIGKGEFMRPEAIAVDNENKVYVADTGNNRIQVFDKDGKFLRIVN